MRKKVLLIAIATIFAMQGKAQMSYNKDFSHQPSITLCSSDGQDSYSYMGKSSSGYFTRGQGFVIRPELYRGLFASIGYQINPYVQTFLSVGYGDGLEGAFGVRAYTGDADWVAMFDLRFSMTEFVLPGASLVAGASYKDLDFGAGLKTYSDGYYYLIVPVLSVGWNIRCYDHR